MNVLTNLKWFVAAIVEKCDAETARKVADSVLDKVEDYIKKTPTKIDDVLLHMIKTCIREPFGIPDNDDIEKDADETVAPEEDAIEDAAPADGAAEEAAPGDGATEDAAPEKDAGDVE